MADGRSANEAAAADLCYGSKSISERSIVKVDDTRVSRERDKNLVDSCNDDDENGGWCWCAIDTSLTKKSTTEAVARPLTPSASTTSTSTSHRRRSAAVIGDASDDRRRDDVARCCACDDSRNNDNNENNERRRDVAAKVVVVVVEEEEDVREEEEAVGAAKPEEKEKVAERRVVGEGLKEVAGAASEPAVVSLLEPAASEDRLRYGESVRCAVATTAAQTAAGFETSDAVFHELTCRENNNNDFKAVHSAESRVVVYSEEVRASSDCDGVRVEFSSRDEAAVVALVRTRAAADVLVNCAPCGENGERNSEIACVDNETREKKRNINVEKGDDEDATNYDEERECREYERGYRNESEKNDDTSNVRSPITRSNVLLVERCISNNNRNSRSVLDDRIGVSVSDFHNIDDKVRVSSLDFVRERSSSVYRVVKVRNDQDHDDDDEDGDDDDDGDDEDDDDDEEDEEEEEEEEDLVLRRKNGAMQAETVTTTKTTTTTMSTTTRKEMAEREIDDGVVVARLGSPFKGQIRMAEDTLVGPCGKKRCADRYDSSESSDSGVAISCGDCSSSGTSDITEPGSPCSTSSDEGVAIRGTAPSPLPTLLKLAPTTPPSHSGTRPQWPWTPPLAATACSAYKRLKGEPEVGTLPKAGATDPTARSCAAGGVKQQSQQQQSASAKSNHHHHHHHHDHESQGKITEYFKAQIKPQQSKLKKTSTEMSLLVAKSSPEFRRPPTVQRNKGGLAKYVGVVLPNGRTSHDREVRTMTISPPPMKKQSTVVPRNVSSKMDKKLCSKVLSGLPIPSDVLSSIPGCKISSLRLVGEASPKPSGGSPPATPTAALLCEPVEIDFSDVSPAKPTVNENNNLTNGCTNLRQITVGLQEHPLTRLSSGLLDKRERKEEPTTVRAEDDDEDEEEEDDSRSGQSKAPSSPILSAPTTIRFPARAPEKKGSRGTDSGICQWDKCEVAFECSGALLEHLQAAHINTQQGGDNFVCHWQGCKVQGRTSCSRRWLERHVLSHGGNKPFRCIVDGCGSRFSSQTALERHVNSHFNQPETSSSSGRRSCESGGKLVRRNGKKLRYRRQPWSARLFDYIDTGVMEGLQHRLLELAKTRTQGRLAETPGNSMALTSQVLARRIEPDGKAKVLLRWYPQDIAPDEWVLETEVQSTKHIGIRDAATKSVDEVSLVLYPAVNGGTPPQTRTKQRRKPLKNS